MKATTMEKINDLYNYIKDFTNEFGYPPTVREIQHKFGIKSTASVAYYLSLLEKDNLLRKSPQKNRAIELVSEKKSPKIAQIPLVGDIAAGIPILAEQNIDGVFPFAEGFFGRGAELFMLTIHGNSMIDIGIYDGDIVVIRSQNIAQNGEIAAVLVGNEATLKRFYKEKDHFRLKPENSQMQDIIVDQAEVLGVAVGLIRRF